MMLLQGTNRSVPLLLLGLLGAVLLCDYSVNSFGVVKLSTRPSLGSTCRIRVTCTRIRSSFYDDFESDDFKEEDDDDEEDEEEYSDLGDLDVASFRSKMSSMFDTTPDEDKPPTTRTGPSEVDELIRLAVGRGAESNPDAPWACPAELDIGTILLANPAAFCDDVGTTKRTPDPSLLTKFGFGFPPPADLGPDRRADLLPVFIIVEKGPSMIRAVLLNRRTGYLLGDLEETSDQPMLEKFCIQPLWLGGVDPSASGGLAMLHLCPQVKGASQLTEDGLYWGGEPNQAQEAMEESTDRVFSGFDFKFFVQSTQFKPQELDKLIESESVFVTSVATSLLFQSRDRMGTRRAKPLWTEIMELLGDKFVAIKDELYER